MTTAQTETQPQSRLRRWFVGKDASFFHYLIARILGGIFSIFTLRAVVGYLSREEYGDWGYLSTLSSMLVPIVSLSLPQAMMRYYFDHKKSDLAAQQSLISTVFRINTWALALLVLAELVLFATGVHAPHEALYFGGVTSALVLSSFFGYLTRTRNDSALFFFNRMFEQGAFLALLLWSTHGAPRILAGSRITSMVLCLVATLWTCVLINWAHYTRLGLLRLGAAMLPRKEINSLIQFSLPLCFTFFAGWALSSSDVYLLRKLSTREETADYVFAVGIVSVVGVVTQSALLDWTGYFYKMMRDESHDRDVAISKRARYFLWLHVATIFGTRLISGYAYELFGAKAYTRGLDFLGWLMLGNFFFLAGNLFSVGLSFAKKTRLTLVGFAIPSALNFGVNLLLIPRYGAKAAAGTTVASYALFATIMLLLGKTHYRFREGAAFALVITAAIVAALIPLPFVR